MYTKASNHFDKIKDADQAELYRQKMQMLFIKPAIMAVLSGATPQPPV